MAERKPLSKSLRFEVFKRDSFTCQYCGAKAPDVILEVDHIKPVAEGGTNEILNLITCCRDCNRGKGKRTLNNNSVIEKQRQQIEELNIRRQQLEMLLEWRDGLNSLDSDINNAAIDYYNKKWSETVLSGQGEQKMKMAVKRYGLNNVIEMIDTQYDKYYAFDKDEEYNFKFIFEKVLKALNYNSMPAYRQKISYIKGILKNKMSYFNENKFYCIIKDINNSESYDLLCFIEEEVKKFQKIKYSELESIIYGLIDIFNSRSND